MSHQHVNRSLTGQSATYKNDDYDRSNSTHFSDLTKSFFNLVEGLIVDTTAYVHNYKVQLDNHLGVFNATLVVQSSLNLVGARLTNTLNVGCRVLCAWKAGMARAYIVGVLPIPTEDPTDAISDVTVPASNVGLASDEYTQGPFLLTGNLSVSEENTDIDNTGAVEESGGRPFDNITVGEVGSMAETGLAFHNDPFMVYMRVNEETGVFGFYPNNLLRVGGHNLEVASSSRERFDTNQFNKVSSEEGFSPYLWEASGLKNPCDTAGFTENDEQTVQIDDPYYYYIEPANDYQQPFRRYTKYHGYLAGGGEKNILATWPTETEFLKYFSPEVFPGLYEQQVLGTGRQITRSASGIIIAKNGRITVPKRYVTPLTADDPEAEPVLLKAAYDLQAGTGLKVCSGSGSGGSGSQSGQAPQAGSESGSGSGGLDVDPQWRAGAFIDQIAYSFNYEAVQPFYEQPMTFFTAEESQTNVADEAPDYTTLGNLHTLPAPLPVTVEIDGRYGTASFYPNNSYMAFLDDGGIVIVDGWGSEIKMVGGNVYISSAADTFINPGRNANIMAGYDFTARANNSADITTANKDIRIKAERNLMVLGGNDACGGVLIESKTPSPSYQFHPSGEEATVTGIVLKAKKGQIVGLAQDIYLSSELFMFDDEFRKITDPIMGSGSGSGSGSEIGSESGSGSGDFKPALFVINSGEKGKIKFIGKALERNAYDYMLDVVNDIVAFEVYNDSVYVGMDVGIHGSLVTKDNVVSGNWIYAKQHIGTERAQEFCFQVFDYQDDRLDRAVARIKKAIDAANEYWYESYDENTYDHLLKAAGNVYDAEFTFRTDSQYKTSGFILYETRWQQIARESGQILPTWKEQPVVSRRKEVSYPYPGNTAWVTAESGRYVPLKLHDDLFGYSIDRGSARYTKEGFGEPQPYTLDDNYTVVIDARV